MQQISKTAEIIFLLLSPAVIILFFNNIDNKHTHILPSGEIIEHAHPYKTNNTAHNPIQSHKHTKNFIILLNIINSAISTLSFLLFFSFTIFLYQSATIFNKNIIFTELPFQKSFSSRAPPFPNNIL
jgi:hypothetical protein